MVKKGKHTSNFKIPKGLDAAIEHVLQQDYAERVDIAIEAGLLNNKTLGRDIAHDLRVSIDWNRELKEFDITITFPDEPDAETINNIVHSRILEAMKREDMAYEPDYAQGLSGTYSILNMQGFCRAINSMTSPENKIRYFDLKRGV